MGILIDHSKKALLKPEVAARKCLATPLSSVLPSRPWFGKTCFIIGGGPSLSGFNWSVLKGFNVIGTNKSFLFYPADINYSMDYNFFDLMQNTASAPGHIYYKQHLAWKNYAGLKVFLRRNSNLRFAKEIYYLEALKNEVVSHDIGSGIWPGNNTGCGALMLALALGSTKVGLLGFDFRINDKQTHFHDGYYFQKRDALQRNLLKFCECLDSLVPLLKSEGVEVVNLSPSSELKNYPKGTMESFLKVKTPTLVVQTGLKLHTKLPKLPKEKRRVLLVGGGPSVKRQDLMKLTGNVGIDSIVINCAVFDAPKPTAFITKDYSFLLKVPSILRATGDRRSESERRWKSAKKVFVASFAENVLKEKDGVIVDTRYNLVYDLSGIDEIVRAERKSGISRSKEEFCAGIDSGYSALQYAIVQGYNEIYLLGYDMNISCGEHYHDWYAKRRQKFQRKLDKYFEFYSRAFFTINTWPDIKVYSCSSISRLNSLIPYVELRTIL